MVLNILSFIVTTTGLICTIYIFNLSVNSQRKKAFIDAISKARKDIFLCMNQYVDDHVRENHINYVLHSRIKDIIETLAIVDDSLEKGLPLPGVHRNPKEEKVTYKLKNYICDVSKAFEDYNIYNFDLLYEFDYGDTYFLQHYDLNYKFIRNWKKLYIITGVKLTFKKKSDKFRYGTHEVLISENIEVIDDLEKLKSYVDYMNQVMPLLASKLRIDNESDLTVNYTESNKNPILHS